MAGSENTHAKQIFVIEDDDSIRGDLVELLSLEGYRAEAFRNGKEALDTLNVRPVLPHLALLDLMMPVMDGYGFLEAISREPRFLGLPIIVFSADRLASSRLPKARVKALLAKPVDIDHLLQTVQKHAL